MYQYRSSVLIPRYVDGKMTGYSGEEIEAHMAEWAAYGWRLLTVAKHILTVNQSNNYGTRYEFFWERQAPEKAEGS